MDIENGKEIEVISEESKALTQLDPEALERAPSLGIQRIKPKHGKLVVSDDLVAQALNVVFLDHARLNAFFSGPYVEGSNSKPDCFAADIHEAAMAPPRFVPARQSDHCVNCWANAFESDSKGGKGKACRNSIRAVGLLAAPPQTPGGEWDGMLLEFPIAPTSMKAFERLRVRVESYRKRALRSVMTRVSLDPTSNFPMYIFEPIEDVVDKGLIDLILRYPLGPQTAIRQHLLRGWAYDAKEESAAPISTVRANETVQTEDEEIPF